MSLSSSSVFNNKLITNQLDPSEAIDFVINHPNYQKYLNYLKTWKEELNEDSSDRAEKICHMFNLGMVGHGDRRVCCYYEDYIIKLPLESCNTDCNYSENNLFELLKDKSDLCEHLCPILKYDNDLIVTPLCSELDVDDEEFNKIINSIVYSFETIGIKFTDLDKQDQFGILNGKIVILDYEDYEFIDL